MSDYISRDAAVEQCKRHSDYTAWSIEDGIEVIPAADVEPVRRGRWVNMGGFPACSECACSPAVCEPKPNNPKGFPEWCYGCGAKMELEDNNGT